MKIILSPSKTQNFNKSFKIDEQTPLLYNESAKLAEIISKYTIDELAGIFKLKGKLLVSTYESFQSYSDTKIWSPAILAYTGEVFKQMDIEGYDTDMLVYLQNHLIILSALYGALRPFDSIKPYRLDMNKRIMKGATLYKFWDKPLNDYFEGETIINLASNEFSKTLKMDLININFLQKKDDGYKNVAIYSKRARGTMLNYMVKNTIEDTEDIKLFNEDGYVYCDELSSDRNIVFVR